MRAVEQERARIEAAENVEGLWKAVFLLVRSTSVSQLLRQKRKEIKTKGMRRSFLLISRVDTESKDVFNSERVFGKHFVSGKPAP